MSDARLNRAIVAELHELTAQQVLTYGQLASISERYPTSRWDVSSLARWLTLLGAVAMGVGALVLVPRIVDLQNAIDGGLALLTVALVGGGGYLGKQRGMRKTGAALELLGSFALQALLTALAVRFSTGSKNWPALVALCAGATGLLAYALPNRLVLIHALVNAFVALGGEAGYVSGWGMYYLRMDYPTLYLVAGLVTLGLSWAHAKLLRGERQGFARVWAHFGLLVLHLALWFFALFGFYNGLDNFRWEGMETQRLLFSVLWAGVSVGCLLMGARQGLRLARGYGLTFLIINLYTFYFQFVAYRSGELWFIHLLLVGGSMVGGGIWLERRLSARSSATPPVGA